MLRLLERWQKAARRSRDTDRDTDAYPGSRCSCATKRLSVASVARDMARRAAAAAKQRRALRKSKAVSAAAALVEDMSERSLHRKAQAAQAHRAAAQAMSSDRLGSRSRWPSRLRSTAAGAIRHVPKCATAATGPLPPEMTLRRCGSCRWRRGRHKRTCQHARNASSSASSDSTSATSTSTRAGVPAKMGRGR